MEHNQPAQNPEETSGQPVKENKCPAAAASKKTGIKHPFVQFLIFTCFSLSAGAIQLLSNALLNTWTHWLTNSNHLAWLAYLIGLILSVIWNFTLNRKFTFRSASNVPLAMTLVILYYIPFALFSTLWYDPLLKLMNDASGVDLDLLLTAIMMIINFATEFLWDKFLVFNDKVMAKIEKAFHIKNRHISQEDLDKLRERDVLVVGAGISGLTCARSLAEAGCSVTVVELRDTVGGNLYDYTDENNVRVQKYGPHIFHTNDEAVYNFLSRFTEWTPYEHRVLGLIDGTLVPVPFNLTSLFKLFPEEEAQRIQKTLLTEVGEGQKVPITKLKEHADPLIRSFADFVYKKVFEFYTEKQWGCKIEELDAAVASRVPVYLSHEDRYFTDSFQYQPTNGFTSMAQAMLDHPNIKLYTGKDALLFLKIKKGRLYIDSKPYEGSVVFTGRIDELFRKKYGALPYRSLDFVFETHDTSSYQEAAVVNYTTSEPFTRISEFSKFTCAPQEKTVIVKEYSKACGEKDIPYYPIPKEEYREAYRNYQREAESIPGLYLAGRLACYRYLNTDAAVKEALVLVEKIKQGNKEN